MCVCVCVQQLNQFSGLENVMTTTNKEFNKNISFLMSRKNTSVNICNIAVVQRVSSVYEQSSMFACLIPPI